MLSIEQHHTVAPGAGIAETSAVGVNDDFFGAELPIGRSGQLLASRRPSRWSSCIRIQKCLRVFKRAECLVDRVGISINLKFALVPGRIDSGSMPNSDRIKSFLLSHAVKYDYTRRE